MKKVSGKKERDAAAAEKVRQAEKAAASKNEVNAEGEEAKDTKDLFGDEDNEDVIF